MTEMPPPRLPLTLIAAVSPTNGLGKNGGLPWSLRGEMAYFRRATTHVPSATQRNAVIMGRNTWESIPPKFRPLKGRVNVVVSRSVGKAREGELGINEPDSFLVSSLDAALDLLGKTPNISRAFLIGGSQLYTQALESPDAIQSLLITRILTPEYPDCDVFLPEFRTQEQVEGDEQRAKEAGRDHVVQATPLAQQTWIKQSYAELAESLGGEGNVQAGIVAEGEVKYEFQLWNRAR